MHIVLIGGGSGVSNLLTVFRKDPNVRLTAIISTSDSGGSTGVLRQSYEVPALGDMRKNLSALAGENALWTEHRFEHGFLDGHPVGNVWLLGLIEQYGFREGLARAHQMLDITQHQILPATESIHDILVTLKNGEKILGEDHIIAQSHLSHEIAAIELTPHAHAYPPTLQALKEADVIVIGPGTFYTSLIPCLLPTGMLEAFRASQARKILVANATNFPVGHCDGYDIDVYLAEFARLLGDIALDSILVHDTSGVDATLRVPVGNNDPRKIIDDFFTTASHTTKSKFDSIPRNTFKHDAERVLQTIKTFL